MFELHERSFHLVVEWRAAKRPQNRAAEIQGTEFCDIQSGLLDPVKRLSAQLPDDRAVHLLVVQREPGLERASISR
jgi:hypothetical protein